ncbi:MAG: glycosyltransferase [Cytophagaceae bacterium]|nr:glycosyltransferase [Cytophagaceae bacterium]
MRITLINSYGKGGGAAIACQRLKKALSASAQVQLLTLTGQSKWYKLRWLNHLFWEKLFLIFKLKDRAQKFYFDDNRFGFAWSSHSDFKKADIIHLHWINQGFLSMKELEKIVRSGKPVLWTLHDMWPFTGGCHYTGPCERVDKGCGQCYFLTNAHAEDYSSEQQKRKKILYSNYRPVFIACSHWLADAAKKSTVMQDCDIHVIPNAIDTSVFKPGDKQQLRHQLGWPVNKKLVLFSSARLDDPRKGVTLLLESLQHLAQTEVQHEEIALVFMGALQQALPPLPFDLITTGFISGDESLANYYGACDAFVLPSKEDNLPNTVMEAMACGLPTVAYAIGGLADLIDHAHNGYLASPFDTKEFAHGIAFCLQHQEALSKASRNKTVEHFSESVVREKHLQVYRQALSRKQIRIS